MATVACLAFSILLGATGHILVKEGLTRAGSWFGSLFQPLLILGVICYFASMVLWLPFLQGRPVARAVPVAGLTYAVVAVMSGVIKGEWLGVMQWFGVIMVGFGVYLLLLN
ncbi:MAG: EamA family transporter [Firmicutes bacterium]|nr:EamA family transporter [Bacillota bacterium]